MVKINNFMDISIINYNNVVSVNTSQIDFDGKIYDGFYISYNNYDTNIYGDVTTALVLGQMQKFYILRENHIKQYKKIIKENTSECFDKCLAYFRNCPYKVIKYTDK